MSERAQVLKKIAEPQPQFILLSDMPIPKEDAEGIHASLLSEGYVPDTRLAQQYMRHDASKAIYYQPGAIFPTNTVYRHSPKQAEQERAYHAGVIQRAWRAHKETKK
jgi:hypothetical protein